MSVTCSASRWAAVHSLSLKLQPISQGDKTLQGHDTLVHTVHVVQPPCNDQPPIPPKEIPVPCDRQTAQESREKPRRFTTWNLAPCHLSSLFLRLTSPSSAPSSTPQPQRLSHTTYVHACTPAWTGNGSGRSSMMQQR